MGAPTCFHRDQTRRALGKKLGELGAFDLPTLDLASLYIDDVKLENGLGQIQANDGQICSR
jgi:hypothetical protein